MMFWLRWILGFSSIMAFGDKVGDWWDDIFGDDEHGKTGIMGKLVKTIAVAAIVFFVFKFFGRKIINYFK
jgi:hypothetical protein